jgi:hypothetical protein
LACIKECIAPHGSSRENHRQDQAVFTVLYYNYHLAQLPKKDNMVVNRELFAYLIGNYIGYSIHNDERKLMLTKPKTD